MSRCAACGRLLRRPSPSGLGPVCARRLGATSNRRPPATRTDPPVEHIPGQTALELQPMQPSLWSI